VLHLITGLHVGGAEQVLVRLLGQSDRRRFLHTVVSVTEPGPVAERLRTVGVKVCTLGMRPGTPSLRGLVRLVKILRRLRPDLLQCWMYHANLLGLLAGKLARVPHIVWTIRSSNENLAAYRWLTRWTVRLCVWLSRFPDCSVFASEAGSKLHQSWGFAPSKTVVISNGADLDIFRPDGAARHSVRQELGLSDDTILIGLIARFHPMKDHQTFFKAVSSARLREHGVHFLLAGEGITPANLELARVVKQSSLEGCVHVLGCREDIPRLTAALDIACLSSWSESFPNVVGEAMACGVPCVVTDVGDSARIVGDTGRVVPPRSPQALAAALSEMIAMGPAGRQVLGKKARQRVAQEFSLAKMVQTYESLYESIAGRV